MSGKDFINELIDAFLDEGPLMIQNMQTALEAGDVESFRRNAHSLKSNANTFGATELANQAKELETMSREKNLDLLIRSMERLDDTYFLVILLIRSMERLDDTYFLVIAGAGHYETELRELAKTPGDTRAAQQPQQHVSAWSSR